MKLAGIFSNDVSTRLAPFSESSHVPRSESLRSKPSSTNWRRSHRVVFHHVPRLMRATRGHQKKDGRTSAPS